MGAYLTSVSRVLLLRWAIKQSGGNDEADGVDMIDKYRL